jgi:hypothetical protein
LPHLFNHSHSGNQKQCASLEEKQHQLQLYGFLSLSISGTFSCAIPLENVRSLGYLLVLVWILGIILSVKFYGAQGGFCAYGWVTMVYHCLWLNEHNILIGYGPTLPLE